MGPILQSAFLKALGWSLIDNLWQMGLVWVLYLAITRSGRKFNPDTRHNLALLSLALGSGWFLFTLIFNTLSGHPTTTSGLSEYIGHIPGKLENLLPWISVVYLLVASILSLRLYRQLDYTKKLSTQGLKKANPQIRIFLQQHAGQMGLKKEIRVWISQLVETPLTIGFWKPVILLPVSIVNNLSMKQTESIILHELYHIQRNDFIMNLLIAVADIILFFNPFARFFKDVIQKEREHRCDDMVMQYRYSPTLYAQALLILEKLRPGQNEVSTGSQQKMSIAATGTNKMMLFARVKRLLTGETVATPISTRLAAYLVPALLIGYLGLIDPAVNVTTRQAPVTAVSNEPGRLTYVSDELSKPFRTQPPTAPPAYQNITEGQELMIEKPAAPYQNEDFNLEKDLAELIITEKVEELLINRAGAPYAEYINTEKPLEYTISISDQNVDAAEEVTLIQTEQKPYPYVPGSSFFSKPMYDTILQQNVSSNTAVDLLLLAKTLNSIDELDWAKMEENLAKCDKEVDLNRLQLELKKAAAEVDWKSLNADLEKVNGHTTSEVQKDRHVLAERYLKLEKLTAEQSLRFKPNVQRIVEGPAAPIKQAKRARATKVMKIVNI